jgi:hypothetical protein
MKRVGDVAVRSLKWRTQSKTVRRVLPLVYDVVCIAMGCIVNGKGVVRWNGWVSQYDASQGSGLKLPKGVIVTINNRK